MGQTTVVLPRAFGFSHMIALALATATLLGFSGTTLAEKREFKLSIDEVTIEPAPGMKYKAFAFNGQVPGPLLHMREGDDVTVHVTNNTTLNHTIHWHGVPQTNNWEHDGVPGVTQKAIEPGETYTYTWKANRTGSLWYHCHVNVHEHVGIRGMWGPMIIDPAKPTALEKKVTKEAIMMLSTWESKAAEHYGEGGTPMDMTDFFSVNAKTFPANQPIRVKKGDVLRIRFYGAGGSIHAMHPHGHDMLVTHKDGLPLPAPYMVDTLLVGPGERYDVIMEMQNPGIFIFHDHVDIHVASGGKADMGPITVFEYEGVKTKDFYPWNGLKFQPDFYYSESMKKGYGLFENPDFKGEAPSRRRR